jgi:hypothetical protein
MLNLIEIHTEIKDNIFFVNEADIQDLIIRLHENITDFHFIDMYKLVERKKNAENIINTASGQAFRV